MKLTLLQNLGEGFWLLVPDPMNTPEHILNQYGQTPLPPYIQRNSEAERVARAESNPDSTRPTPADSTDRDRYQTVYAQKTGAIAAPTAGLHFTLELLQKLHADGISTAFVTLHVGLGTFKPISAPTLREHKMHAERFEVPQVTAAAIQSARQSKCRIVAIGTTTVRTLETLALRCDVPEPRNSFSATSLETPNRSNEIHAMSGSTDIFIYPPYSFRLTDALLTNFHLPKSTLLALVMAFAGIEPTRRAYRHAVLSRYRFFSYGDAMLII